MPLLLSRLRISWGIFSGLLVPFFFICGPLATEDSPFFEVAVGFLLAAGIPFIRRLSVIARLCLVFAVIGTTLIYGDPYRWPGGLFITLGLPLLAFFILKGATRLIRRLNIALHRLGIVRDRSVGTTNE
jgi:hypothetical protein